MNNQSNPVAAFSGKKFFSIFNLKTGTLVVAVLAISTLGIIAPRKFSTSLALDCGDVNQIPSIPTFNPFGVVQNGDGSYPTVSGSNCADQPTLSVKRDGTSTYYSSLNGQAGDQFVVSSYIHNGARQDIGDADKAYNITATFNIDQNSGNVSVTLNGQDSNGNAMGGNRTGNIHINMPAGSQLQVIPGTGIIEDHNSNPTGSAGVSNSSSFTVNLGDQSACFDFARFFDFTVKIVGVAATAPSNLNLTINNTTFCVYSKGEHSNDTIIYTIQGSSDLAGQQIAWSSTKNGASTGEVNANYGQALDGNASLNIPVLWTLNDAGGAGGSESWTKTVVAVKNGQIVATSQPAVVSFTVRDCSTTTTTPPPGTSTINLTINNTTFCVYSKGEHSNDTIIYTIQGSSDLAGQQIAWSSTRSAVPTGENNANYGQTLNGSAFLSIPVQWTLADAGGANGNASWSKSVVGLKNGQIVTAPKTVNFIVKDCSTITTAPPALTNPTLSITNLCVGQAPTYTVRYDPSLAGDALYWSSTAPAAALIATNGQNESNANYGQILDGSGTWTSQGSKVWASTDIGNWTKTVGLVKNGQPVANLASFPFTVSNCGTTPPPTTLACAANVSSANIGDNVTFNATGGNGFYTWGVSNNPTAGSGSVFNVYFLSGGATKTVTVTSNGQTATCNIFINAAPNQPAATGNCNNVYNSCNNNANNNTQNGSGTNSSNQNNANNINGNNNTVTNTNNNCVNNSCNNTTTYNNNSIPNNYNYPVYTPPPVYYPPQPVYVASNNYTPAVLGSSVNLVYSKSAINDTKNADATTVNASREDYITYTLTVSNTGNSASSNFVVTDDLSQVLPFADIADNGGGYLNGNTISFPAVTVPANGSVQESFEVRVKFSLAQNLAYTMTNTYGNTITIHINSPSVLGAFTAPKTGADSNAFVFAGLLTAVAGVVIKRKAILSVIFN